METNIQILHYIGSKARMAGILSMMIPSQCTVYAELYCGSAALALNSRKFDIKILNDFNPHISNFWKVATDPQTRGTLLTQIQQSRYSWSGFIEAKERIPLLWSDIDLEKRTLRVSKKAIVRHDYKSHTAKQEVQDFYKTKSSRRTVMLTAGLVAILAKHKEEMRQRAEYLGEPWNEDGLVFLNTRGNMVYSRNLQQSLYKIYRNAGIKGATMHTLRHTYATRCFEAGVDIKAISEQLGHANVKTTYNTYVHLLHDTKAKEIDKLGEIDKFIA